MRRTTDHKQTRNKTTSNDTTPLRFGALAGAVAGGVIAWLMEQVDADLAQILVVAAGALTGSLIAYVVLHRRRLEEEIEHSAALEALALTGLSTAGFAHEVKNGLMVTQGFAALARRRADRTDDHRLVSQLDAIERETRRMIIELRSFLHSSVEARRLGLAAPPPIPRLADLSRTVESVTGLLRPLAAEREMVLKLEPLPDSPAAVDEPTLRLVLMNLLLNALEHAEKEIRVSVEVAESSETTWWLELAVDDDGTGVPEADQAHLFEPGYTSSSTGAGVGLVYTRNRARRLGGDVELERSGPSGSRFVARLPLHPSAE